MVFSIKNHAFKLTSLVFFVFCQRQPVFARTRLHKTALKPPFRARYDLELKSRKKHAIKEQWIEGLRNRELLFIGVKLAPYGVRRKSPSSVSGEQEQPLIQVGFSRVSFSSRIRIVFSKQ